MSPRSSTFVSRAYEQNKITLAPGAAAAIRSPASTIVDLSIVVMAVAPAETRLAPVRPAERSQS